MAGLKSFYLGICTHTLIHNWHFFWTWIILDWIEHDLIRVWQSETARHDRLAQWIKNLTSNQWWSVLWVQFPLGATLFLLKLFKTPWCQFCTKKPEMPDLCCKIKPWLSYWEFCLIGGNLYTEQYILPTLCNTKRKITPYIYTIRLKN